MHRTTVCRNGARWLRPTLRPSESYRNRRVFRSLGGQMVTVRAGSTNVADAPPCLLGILFRCPDAVHYRRGAASTGVGLTRRLLDSGQHFTRKMLVSRLEMERRIWIIQCASS